jgi:hypothetical protein
MSAINGPTTAELKALVIGQRRLTAPLDVIVMTQAAYERLIAELPVREQFRDYETFCGVSFEVQPDELAMVERAIDLRRGGKKVMTVQ